MVESAVKLALDCVCPISALIFACSASWLAVFIHVANPGFCFPATEQFDGINQDATNSKVPEHHQYFDDPSKLVLSDVQKGQVEILRQLQEVSK